jgi:peptide-methionine (S)-S-oxide reductase
MGLFGKSAAMVSPSNALPGRTQPMTVPARHTVNGNPIKAPFPEGMHIAQFAMGCFWGAEREFWQQPGVFSTAVGYSGGYTPNPTYHETCTGNTGHTEAVLVVYDPTRVSFAQLLKVFWEAHDPTQGNRQGNDTGSQYRSAIYVYTPEQRAAVDATQTAFQAALTARGKGTITTEILGGKPSEATPEFFYAEEYHQQYLDKNPGGYCGLAGTGAVCPLPTGATIAA